LACASDVIWPRWHRPPLESTFCGLSLKNPAARLMP
jgi:hypothetical protein